MKTPRKILIAVCAATLAACLGHAATCNVQVTADLYCDEMPESCPDCVRVTCSADPSHLSCMDGSSHIFVRMETHIVTATSVQYVKDCEGEDPDCGGPTSTSWTDTWIFPNNCIADPNCTPGA